MTVQFVELAGQKMALLPEVEYRRLVDAAEEKADIDAAIAAERRAFEGEEYVPEALLQRLIDGDSPVLVWRTYRALSAAELGEIVGLSEAAILAIEAGERLLDPGELKSMADALAVDEDDLLSPA